jgi:hypothetical protein
MYLSTSFLPNLLTIPIFLIIIFILTKYWSYIFDDQIGDWNGVSIYSNKRYKNGGNIKNYYNGIYTGIKWQCVEYARRYLIIKHGITFSEVASAFEIPNAKFTTLNGDNVTISNELQEGSLIIWPSYYKFNSPDGHVAVISSILPNGITVVEQNYDTDTNNNTIHKFNNRFIPKYNIQNATILSFTPFLN